ncbi:hypothetical protein ACMT1E_00490 [Sphingomonas flavalba]|uniref:hypothetical protein n=1 Tax=Sphingomonas flavalba TaxID=2559804 RepID=UPI0039E134DD
MNTTVNKTTTTASGITSAARDFGGGVSLAYNAATGGYTITDGAASKTFLPADRSAADSTAVISVYGRSDAANRSDQLVLFNPGTGNTVLALTYVSYGAWQTILDDGGSLNVDQRYFVYGIRQGANQPSTGSASYTTQVDGSWNTTSGLFALGGTATFNADFSAMTVSTDLSLTGTDILDGSRTRTLGLFKGTGTIAQFGGGFGGTFAHQGTDAGGNVYSGGFNGAFFGPTGSEMGYTYRLTGANGAAVGAVVGKKN